MSSSQKWTEVGWREDLIGQMSACRVKGDGLVCRVGCGVEEAGEGVEFQSQTSAACWLLGVGGQEVGVEAVVAVFAGLAGRSLKHDNATKHGTVIDYGCCESSYHLQAVGPDGGTACQSGEGRVIGLKSVIRQKDRRVLGYRLFSSNIVTFNTQ